MVYDSDSEEEDGKFNWDFIEQNHTPPGTISVKSLLEKVFRDNFDNQETSDVVLRVGRKEFHAHEMVLSFWSPYFEELFVTGNPDGSETRETVTTITLDKIPTNEKHFERFLMFLYSGQIDLNEAAIWEMVDMASTFEVTELTKICKAFLEDSAKTLTTEKEILDNMAKCKRWDLPILYSRFKRQLQFISRAEMPPVTLKADNFNNFFLNLFNDEATSDVSLVVGESIFHLHIPILCSRSKLLTEIVSTTDDGNSKLVVTPKELLAESGEILGCILKFFYTDEILLDFETVWQVASVAKTLQEDSLLQVCTEFAIDNAWRVPVGADLVYFLHQAEMLELYKVEEMFFQIILANFSFSPNILPNMDLGLLCRVLGRSDLVVNDEYDLYHIIQRTLVKLQENNDLVDVGKILNLIRLDQMTAVQLKTVTDQHEDYFRTREDHIENCLAKVCSRWEQHEDIEESDLLSANDCTLLDIDQPNFLKETDENYRYRHYHGYNDKDVLEVLKFDKLTLGQLRKVMEEKGSFSTTKHAYVQTCLQFMFSIWEQQMVRKRSLIDRGGPRKYLSPPPPFFPTDTDDYYLRQVNLNKTRFKINHDQVNQKHTCTTILQQNSQTGSYNILKAQIPTTTNFQAGALSVVMKFEEEVFQDESHLFPLILTAVVLVLKDELVVASEMKAVPILHNMSRQSPTIIGQKPLTFTFHINSVDHIQVHLYTKPLANIT